jgi:hypothetical protein
LPYVKGFQGLWNNFFRKPYRQIVRQNEGRISSKSLF